MPTALVTLYRSLAPVVLASAAGAQDAAGHWVPSWRPDELPRRLASTDLAEVAWAGWHVSGSRLRALVPDLRHALARLQGEDGLEGQLARLQLLDALIRMHVRMPGEELLPHAVGACACRR